MKVRLFWNASIRRLKLVFIYAIKFFIPATNSIWRVIALEAFFARTERSYDNSCEDYFFHTTNV